MTVLLLFTLPAFALIIAAITGGWVWYMISGLAWIFCAFSYWPISNVISWVVIMFSVASFAGAVWDRRR